MARRHEGLVILSHDHHRGLALALRLKLGDRALLTDGWTHDRKEQARRVVELHDEELIPHFHSEERALFPAMRTHSPETQTLIGRLIREHRDLESMVAGLEGSPETELPDRLVKFGNLLEQHIRAEERGLFPLFETGLPPDLAGQVGEAIRHMHHEKSAARRRLIHEERDVLINTRMEFIFSALTSVAFFQSLWPDECDVRVGAAGGKLETGVEVRFRVGAESLGFAVQEILRDRLIDLVVADPGWTGHMKWDLTDVHGGRRVRCRVDLDPPAGRTGEDLAKLRHACRESLRMALDTLHSLLVRSQAGEG